MIPKGVKAFCIFDAVEKLDEHIEALIFVAESSIPLKEIKSALEETFEVNFSKQDIEEAIDRLIEKYQDDSFAIEVVEISNGFRFMSKGSFHNIIGTYLKQNSKKKLSRSAMETLSIIAYKQPVMKSEIEAIRGVGSDYTVQKLLDKELVEISGRSDGPGRPLLYGTTDKFMDYFGLKSIKDLPHTKEIQPEINSIGEYNEDTLLEDYKPEEE